MVDVKLTILAVVSALLIGAAVVGYRITLRSLEPPSAVDRTSRERQLLLAKVWIAGMCIAMIVVLAAGQLLERSQAEVVVVMMIVAFVTLNIVLGVLSHRDPS